MAAATYGHDLTDWIADSDTAAWTELTAMLGGGNPDEADTESALQATNTCSQATNVSGTTLFSMCRILTGSPAPLTLSTGQVFLIWHGHGVATALATYANGGLRVFVATDVDNWKGWAIGGYDTPPFPYGKWVCNPIDPTIAYDYSNGTPPTGAASLYGVGSGGRLTLAVAKGQPHVTDIIRYGRATARIANGDSGSGYATFAGYATVNDAQTARWGLIQQTSGGYLWKGRMGLGLNTSGVSTAVDFRDSYVTIFVQDCRKVYSAFNKIEITNSSSRVDWTNVSIINTSPSTNASPGDFEMIDAADVNFANCAFVDMNTFIFLSSATVLTSNFVRCKQITAGGASFVGSNILASSVAADGNAMSWNSSSDPDTYLDSVTFSKGALAHHAIGFTSSAPSTMTLRNMTFSGFNASDAQNDSTLYFADKGSDTTWTVNLIGCTGNITYKKARSGDTVTFVVDPVTLQVLVKDINTGDEISGARVLIVVADDVNFPYLDSVTITSSGTTATVAHTGHGLATNDYMIIMGAEQDAYNGVHQITYIGADSYSYTMEASATSPATGTITATMALISNTTDVNGLASDSRTYSNDQPITGWVRKATSGTLYKQQPISDTIDAVDGLSITILLIPDE